MKNILMYAVVLVLLLFVGGFLLRYLNGDSLSFLRFIGGVEMKPISLNQEDISRITQPSIVSIYHHLDGNLQVPAFDIDWNKFDLVFPAGKKPGNLPVDEYIRGTGFIVSEDGYVVTNAHVASNLSYTTLVARQLVALRMVAALDSKSELQKIEASLAAKGIKDEDAEAFGKKLAYSLGDKLAAKSTFVGEEKIVVLNSSSSATSLSELISYGFPAKIVGVNKNYLKDEKDVALLKIEGSNFPTVDLNSEDVVGTGDKIYIYGFPSSGQFNDADVLEPTFTEGTVSGLKDSTTKDFKVIQTSAKVSPGSSGGPLFNQSGQTVGILTFATSASSVGDAFSFAIPVSFAVDMLEASGITAVKNPSSQALQDGVLYLQNNRCSKAIESFEVAKRINVNFYDEKNVSPYIDTCLNIISSGKSIDTALDELIFTAKSLGSSYWILIVSGLILLAIITFVILKLMQRIKKDEQEISHLEHPSITPIITPITTPMPQFTPSTPVTPTPITPVNPPRYIDPSVTRYIQFSLKNGVNKEAIAQNLKAQGWTEEEIAKAFPK